MIQYMGRCGWCARVRVQRVRVGCVCAGDLACMINDRRRAFVFASHHDVRVYLHECMCVEIQTANAKPCKSVREGEKCT